MKSLVIINPSKAFTTRFLLESLIRWSRKASDWWLNVWLEEEKVHSGFPSLKILFDCSLADNHMFSGPRWKALVQPKQSTVRVGKRRRTTCRLLIASWFFLDRWHTLELVDLVRFNSDGMIATIREYFDTRLIHDLVREHEANQGRRRNHRQKVE